jgi:hypothetical protein
VTTTVAAGNGIAGVYGDNACNYSPSRVTEAIVVSAVRIADDAVPSWANFGSCVDIFAPGEQVPGAWIKDDSGNASTTATHLSTGTSEAAPMVAGAAAMYLEQNPSASPSDVQSALTSNATSGAISAQGNGSPDKLLYTAFMGVTGNPTPTPTPTPTQTSQPTPTPTPTQTSSCSGSYGVCRPYLQVAPGYGSANLSAFVADTAHLAGKTVYFFVRSGTTGQVRSLGAATVNGQGYANRYLGGLRSGQAMRIYCKINDAPTISNPRSNDVDFHVK